MLITGKIYLHWYYFFYLIGNTNNREFLLMRELALCFLVLYFEFISQKSLWIAIIGTGQSCPYAIKRYYDSWKGDI